jgi:hypothetical protein
MVHADKSLGGVGMGSQVLSTSVFIDIVQDGVMPGDCGDAGILCEMDPAALGNGGAGAPDGIGTVTVIKVEGVPTVVVAVTNGCVKGRPGECSSTDTSLIFDNVLIRGAFRPGAGTV